MGGGRLLPRWFMFLLFITLSQDRGVRGETYLFPALENKGLGFVCMIPSHVWNATYVTCTFIDILRRILNHSL